MNFLKKYSFLFLLLFCVSCIFTGCSNKKQSDAPAPFSDLSWESSYEDMISLEGEPQESYDSVYEGTTYTYEKEYQGKTGTLKYMFDSNQKLMCIAWAYNAESMDDLDNMYQILHTEVEDVYGESGYNPANSSNYGDVWYLTSGDIIISAFTGQNQYALQYAYLHPLVSKKDEKRLPNDNLFFVFIM